MASDIKQYTDNKPYVVIDRTSGRVIVQTVGRENALALLLKKRRQPADCQFVAGVANVPVYLFADKAARAYQDRQLWMAEQMYEYSFPELIENAERIATLWRTIADAVVMPTIDAPEPSVADRIGPDLANDLGVLLSYDRKSMHRVYVPDSKRNWKAAYGLAFNILVNCREARGITAFVAALHVVFGAIIVLPENGISQFRMSLEIKKWQPTKWSLEQGS